MKSVIFIIVFAFASFYTNAQNYFEEYPITASVVFNGSQNRLECSVYDSVLQTTVYYNSAWLTSSIDITSNSFGKVAYITWVNPSSQDSIYGFIIYDYNLHQFNVQIKSINVINRSVNVACGRMWVTVCVEYENQGVYIPHYYYYRYNMQLHKWTMADIIDYDATGSKVWNLYPVGNTDVVYQIDDLDEMDLFYYDPVADKMNYIMSGCAGWGFDRDDDYLAFDTGCLSNYLFMTYDPQTQVYNVHPRRYLIGGQNHGMFAGGDEQNTGISYYFTYDQGINQWLTDSLYSNTVHSLIIKNRMFAYLEGTSLVDEKVFYIVHDPLQHALVKDSASVSGPISNLKIENGTVSWMDSNGLNIRGYDVSIGWGNFNTPLFLYFHLSDFTSQGQPMVHVRNYSIGTDKIYYDFGDGVISLNNRHVLFHSYSDSGTYNICIYDSSGAQSWCQQINMNLCSTVSGVTSSLDSICEGDSLQLSLASYNGSIQWQSKVGNVWIDEAGTGFNSPVYTITPAQTTLYRARVTNGSCVSAYSNEYSIKVFENTAGAFIPDTLITICQDQYATLQVMNTNATYAWQQLNGSIWVPAPGSSNSPYYSVFPTVSTNYRVIITSGNCFTDTSQVITVNPVPAAVEPVTTNGYTCGPGDVTMLAVSTDTVHWYFSNQLDSIINIGTSFTTFLNTTTSYKVNAINGVMTTAGYADQSIGSIITDTTSYKGLRFYVDSPTFLESVSVYPTTNGSLLFKLYNSTSQRFIAQKSVQITSVPGKTKVNLNFNLQGNITYDMYIVSIPNVSLEVNTSGITYPVNVTGSPVTILGYIDSAFHTTPDFYNFYDWEILSGCKSDYENLQGVVLPPFNTAAITANGPISFCTGESVVLNSSPLGPYTYQWLNNNIVIPGAVGTSYTAYMPGSYKVVLNNNYCNDTSSFIRVTVPCTSTQDPVEKSADLPALTSISFDNLINALEIEFNNPEDSQYYLSLIDPSGREVFSDRIDSPQGINNKAVRLDNLASGLYLVILQSNQGRILKRIFKN